MASKTEEKNELEIATADRRTKKARQNAAARAKAARGESGEGFLAGMERDRREMAAAAALERHMEFVDLVREHVGEINFMGTSEITTAIMAVARDTFLDVFEEAVPADYKNSSRSKYSCDKAEEALWVKFGQQALDYKSFVYWALGQCRSAVRKAGDERFGDSKPRERQLVSA